MPTTSPAVNGLISFYNQNGNTEYFVSQADSDLWYNSPEGTWTPITGTLVITSTQNNLASFAVLNNILYGVDRSQDQFWQWGLTGQATAVPVGALYTVGHVHAGSSDTNCNASFWVAFEGGVRPIQYNVSSVRKGNMIKKELLPYVTHK